jgi:hypothetical protein
MWPQKQSATVTRGRQLFGPGRGVTQYSPLPASGAYCPKSKTDSSTGTTNIDRNFGHVNRILPIVSTGFHLETSQNHPMSTAYRRAISLMTGDLTLMSLRGTETASRRNPYQRIQCGAMILPETPIPTRGWLGRQRIGQPGTYNPIIGTFRRSHAMKDERCC